MKFITNKASESTLKKISKIFGVIVMIIMVIYCISLLIPLFWMIISSFKSQDDFILHAYQLPVEWKFSNYAELFEKFRMRVTKWGVGTVEYGLPDMLFYSLAYSICWPMIQVFFYTLCAYVISRFDFPGKNFIYALGIFLMITPIIGTFPASMKIHKALGLYDNFLGRMLMQGSGTFYGFNFILMYGAWKSIPWAYAEAAYIDGASNLKVYLKVMFPLIVPTAAVLFVLSFLSCWTNYIDFLVWFPSYPNLAVGMYLFQYNASLYMVGTPIVLAGFAVLAIPTTILYLLSQKLIMSKLNVGGLKG